MTAPAKKPYRFLTVRAVVIALVLLALLDIALRTVPAFDAFPDDFRFPKVTTMGFQDYTRFMAREDGVRVAVVGDSVTQGLCVERNETMPAHLDARYEAAGRDVHAYNFGISAAHGNDMLAAVSKIADEGAADVVVIMFSYHFFLEVFGEHEWDLRYPQLWRDPSVFGPFEKDPYVTRYTRSVAETESWVEDAAGTIGRGWKLYGSRDAYAASVLEKTAPEALRTTWEQEIWGKEPVVWTHPKDLGGYNRGRLAWYFDGRRLNTHSPQMNYLRKAIQRARAEGMQVVLLSTPLDVNILEEFDLLTWEDYADEMRRMDEFATEEGAVFFDAGEGGFPYNTLADTIHPLGPGYAEMAKRTEAAIEPIVSELEAEKERDR